MKHPPFHWRWEIQFENIAQEVSAERTRQQAKFGEQNCPDALPQQMAAIVSGEEAKELCQNHFADGRGTWTDILCEEVAEAVDEAYMFVNGNAADTAALRAELVQVAAVAVAWIEAIDRR